MGDYSVVLWADHLVDEMVAPLAELLVALSAD